MIGVGAIFWTGLLAASEAFADVSALQALQGTWVQECWSRTVKTEMVYGDKVALRERFHSDDECAKAMSELVSTGGFVLAEDRIDFTFDSVHLRPLTGSMVAVFNQARLCGVTDWSTSAAQEITGKACDFFGIGKKVRAPKKGEMRYGIYRVDASKDPAELYFGQLTPEMNGRTPERRPVEFDPKPYIKK